MVEHSYFIYLSTINEGQAIYRALFGFWNMLYAAAERQSGGWLSNWPDNSAIIQKTLQNDQMLNSILTGLSSNLSLEDHFQVGDDCSPVWKFLINNRENFYHNIL